MARYSFLACAVAVTCFACSSSSLADAPSAPSAADFKWQKAITSSTRFELHNMNGRLQAEPANDGVLSVVAVKSGRLEDFAHVNVVVKEDGGTIVACALWPGQSTCPASGSVNRGEKADVRVDFVVRLPPKVDRIDVETMNGSLSVTNVEIKDGMRLSTMNGRIDIVASGPVDARTMNGAVTAQLTAKGAPVHLATHNGRIELALPADADADVEASTLRGTISNAFGSAPAAPFPGTPVTSRFRIGAGGVRVGLETLNGNVVLRRGA